MHNNNQNKMTSLNNFIFCLNIVATFYIVFSLDIPIIYYKKINILNQLGQLESFINLSQIFFKLIENLYIFISEASPIFYPFLLMYLILFQYAYKNTNLTNVLFALTVNFFYHKFF